MVVPCDDIIYNMLVFQRWWFSSMLNCMHVLCAADFVLLMCASQQWKVFEDEQTENWMVLAGENTDCPDPMENQLFNPAPNYINCRQKQLFIYWTNNLHILDLSDYRNVIFILLYEHDWNGRLEPFTIYTITHTTSISLLVPTFTYNIHTNIQIYTYMP